MNCHCRFFFKTRVRTYKKGKLKVGMIVKYKGEELFISGDFHNKTQALNHYKTLTSEYFEERVIILFSPELNIRAMDPFVSILFALITKE